MGIATHSVRLDSHLNPSRAQPLISSPTLLSVSLSVAPPLPASHPYEQLPGSNPNTYSICAIAGHLVTCHRTTIAPPPRPKTGKPLDLPSYFTLRKTRCNGGYHHLHQLFLT